MKWQVGSDNPWKPEITAAHGFLPANAGVGRRFSGLRLRVTELPLMSRVSKPCAKSSVSQSHAPAMRVRRAARRAGGRLTHGPLAVNFGVQFCVVTK